MNFLAHFYLSAPDEALIRGGFLGDFVKGQLRGKLSEPLELGVRLHRHIDSFTDQHSAQKKIRQKLPAHFSRFSGIVTDMMCDHFLSKRWSEFHQGGLQEFNQKCMRTIESETGVLNEQARWVFERMNQGNWLLNYDNLDYVGDALARIGQRMRYANPLAECKSVLPSVCDQIETDCLEILNDTRNAVTEWRASYLPEADL